MKDKGHIIKIGEEVQIPRNSALEKEVLGEILIVGEQALTEIENIITPASFYDEANAIIFATLLEMQASHKPITILDLTMALMAKGQSEAIGGPVYLADITRSVATTAYLVQHATELHQCEVQRSMFVLAEKIKAMASDSYFDAEEVMEMAERGLTEIQVNTTSGQAKDMVTCIGQLYDWVMDNADNKNKPISTGLAGLDRILNGGFRAPDLVVVGGRPSMGKTQFAVHFAEQACLQGKKTYFVSIEMTAKQLIARMAAREGVSYSHMRQGTIYGDEFEQLNMNLERIQHLPLMIADSPECRNLSYIKSEARRLKRQGKLDIMIIDYLGLIRTNQRFEKRYIEVGYITGELKALAKELEVPIILLAQLSRPPQGQEKQPPKMESLRESGDIEQDADVIIFPHRPYVYDHNACDETGRTWKDRGVLLVEKNREGERNVKTFFMNDPQFKEFWDDESANDQLPTA